MKTILGSIVAVAALGAVPEARAVDPPRTTGHVLVLDGDRVVEGQIERDGDRYRVRRSVGETVLPAAGAVYLCDTMAEAYAYLRSCANLRDADERLRLARWCHLHGLKDEAVAEARAAAALRPQSEECQRLVLAFGRPAPPPRPASPPAVAVTPAPPPVDIPATAMTQFVVRAQPILLNACASCHASGRAGSFRLVRAMDDGVLNRRATQLNLAAVMAQVNRQHCEASPLLVKAASAHGPAGQPPLKSRQAPAYRSLEEWVRAAAGGPASEPEPVAAPTLVAARATERAEPAKAGPPNATPARPADGEPVSTVRPAVPTEPSAAPPGPADPFDPAIFNQAVHGGRKPEEIPPAGDKAPQG